MLQLIYIYSLDLKSAVIDDDHILLSLNLASLLPGQLKLCLAEGSKLKAVPNEEVLSDKGLARKLLRLGRLMQWEVTEGIVVVCNTLLGGGQVGGTS